MTIPQYSQQDLAQISHSFTNELHNATTGKKTSLAFLENPLSQIDLQKSDDVVQVMSIGGTLCKTAYVQKHDNACEFTEYDIVSIPLFDSKEHFLTFIENHIKPDTTILALNFAYPLQPVLRKGYTDGILVRSTKEHMFQGLVGESVGLSIEEMFSQNHNRTLKVVTANDTICLALSGLEVAPWDKIVGGIVGTGTNMGFFTTEHSIVNLESGNFDKLTPTESGIYVDSISTNPSKHLFEKEVSGAYLYQHYNYYVNKIDPDAPKVQMSTELSAIDPSDKERYDLVNQLVKRSASLFAAQIAGMITYKHQDHLSFVMEGSVFWDIPQYVQAVYEQLNNFHIPSESFSFHHIKNSNLEGGARLVYRQ